MKQVVTRDVIPAHPFDFHVRYYWTDTIDYEIVNPDTDIFASEAEQPNTRMLQKASIRGRVQAWLLKTIRNLFSQHARNHQIDLIQLLHCTSCGDGRLVRKVDEVVCRGCGKFYPVRNGIPDMTHAAETQP